MLEIKIRVYNNLIFSIVKYYTTPLKTYNLNQIIYTHNTNFKFKNNMMHQYDMLFTIGIEKCLINDCHQKKENSIIINSNN